MSALIPPDQLRVEIIDPTPGGQQVYPKPMDLKVTHLPSGIVAVVPGQRSQFDARQIALDMIASAVTHPRYRP